MVRRYLCGLIVAATLAGCRSQPVDPDETITAKLSASTATLTVSVPPNVDVGGCVLGAAGSVSIADRGDVAATICNVGTTGTTVGVDARVRDVLTRARLTTRDRALVAGRVDTTQSIQAAPTSTIVGPVNTQASFSPLGTETRTVSFPAAPDIDVILQPDQVASRDPGRYRNLTLSSRARLHLRTGTYYFETLGVIEPQSALVLDERSGPVVIYVKQPFAFRGQVESNIGHPDWLIGVTGTGTIAIEAPFRGTILAPSARIVLGTGETTHSGAFHGRDIEVQPGVRIQHRPSSEIRPGRRTCAVDDALTQTALSSFWQTFDAGSPSGSTAMNAHLRLTAGGSGLSGTKDGFRFVHQPTTGDLDTVVQVLSMSPHNGVGGLMLRGELSATAPFAAVVVNGSGTVSFRSRASAGQPVVVVNGAAPLAFPGFLRLSREGQRVAAYRSADGRTWQAAGSVNLSLPDGVHAGIVAASASAGSSAVATFRDFDIRFAGDCGKCVAGVTP